MHTAFRATRPGWHYTRLIATTAFCLTLIVSLPREACAKVIDVDGRSYDLSVTEDAFDLVDDADMYIANLISFKIGPQSDIDFEMSKPPEDRDLDAIASYQAALNHADELIANLREQQKEAEAALVTDLMRDLLHVPPLYTPKNQGSRFTGKEGLLVQQKLDPKRNKDSLVADPVDTTSGAHVITQDLLRVTGAVPMNFELAYNSLLLNLDAVGRGWSHNYEAKAVYNPGTPGISLRWNANRVNEFRLKTGESNVFVSTDDATRHDTIIRDNDGSMVLIRQDQSRYEFDPAGLLIRLVNHTGQVLEVSYDPGQTIPSQVREPISGKVLSFHYNGQGLLSSVTDDLNRSVAFGYDSDKNLTGITDAAGKISRYTYTKTGQVLTCTDAEGVVIFKNTYDTHGRVTSQDDGVAGNALTNFVYDEATSASLSIAGVKNRLGKSQVFLHDNDQRAMGNGGAGNQQAVRQYDSEGQVTTWSDGAQSNDELVQETYTYDERGNRLTLTDRRGAVTTMTYDERNNLLARTNPDNTVASFEYNANNRLLKATDELSRVTTYDYDTDGLLLTTTLPNGGIITRTYNAGMLSSETDPTGNTTAFTYDAAGRLLTRTDAAGKTTAYAYDGKDNVTSITDPANGVTTSTYDSHGHVLKVTDPNLHVTAYTYDGNGNLKSETNPLGQTTLYTYDGEDHLTQVKDPLGHVTNYEYDLQGQIASTTNAAGNKSVYTRDIAGRVLSVAVNGVVTAAFTYDANGNQISSSDGTKTGAGNTLAFTNTGYDSLNRPISRTDPISRAHQYARDAVGQITQTTDPASHNSNATYDLLGNPATLQDANGNTSSYTYDDAGRRISETLASGGVIAYAYNNRGLLSQKTNARGQVAALTYDDAGRLATRTDPTGTISYTYDAKGNLLTVTESGKTLTRTYDALDRMITYQDGDGNLLRYGYDAAGNLSSLTYPDGKVVLYEYDAANRLTKVTDWAARVTTYVYDAQSRVIQEKRPDGYVWTRTYDASGKLLSLKDDPLRPEKIYSSIGITYNPAGDLLSEDATPPPRLDAVPGATLTYGNDNRVATFNSQAITHDADGNMTSGPAGNGSFTAFVYDARNRLTNAGGISYAYDAEDHRISQTDGGSTTRYLINPQPALSQVLIKTDAQNQKTYFVYGLGLIAEQGPSGYRCYHYDRLGSTIALTDGNGTVTRRFAYGLYGEFAGDPAATPTPFLYNGRDGVMTDANGLSCMRSRYYSPLMKRFITQDSVQGSLEQPVSLNRFAYTGGNPISFIDPAGTTRLDSDGEARTKLIKKWNSIEHSYQRNIGQEANNIMNSNAPREEKLKQLDQIYGSREYQEYERYKEAVKEAPPGARRWNQMEEERTDKEWWLRIKTKSDATARRG